MQVPREKRQGFFGMQGVAVKTNGGLEFPAALRFVRPKRNAAILHNNSPEGGFPPLLTDSNAGGYNLVAVA